MAYSTPGKLERFVLQWGTVEHEAKFHCAPVRTCASSGVACVFVDRGTDCQWGAPNFADDLFFARADLGIWSPLGFGLLKCLAPFR